MKTEAVVTNVEAIALKGSAIALNIGREQNHDKTNRPSGSPVPHRDGNRQDGGWTHQVRSCAPSKQ